MSVRPSVQKRFLDFNEIWYVGRGRRTMHDGIDVDLITWVTAFRSDVGPSVHKKFLRFR